MGRLCVEHYSRYPPFEAERWDAAELPMSIHTEELKIGLNEEEARETLKSLAPSFKLGSSKEWMIERRYVLDGEPLENTVHEQNVTECDEFPLVVSKQRSGWYLTPHPIHAAVRRFINGVVIVLLLSLGYLFIEPILSAIGIPSIGTGTVRFGLLDYPLLALIVVPLLFAPMALRVGANLGDLQRQREFLANPPSDPEFEFDEIRSDKSLKVKVTIPEKRDDWKEVFITWRVGVLPPAREAVIKAQNGEYLRQPPPGLTTELPHHWESGLDDGTAGGEDAPMEHRDIKGGLFLRPMRVMEKGDYLLLDEGKEMTLEGPSEQWPGSVCNDLVRVHWELILHINREKGGPLLYVKPLKVAHPKSRSTQKALKINDGRTESDKVDSNPAD